MSSSGGKLDGSVNPGGNVHPGGNVGSWAADSAADATNKYKLGFIFRVIDFGSHATQWISLS